MKNLRSFLNTCLLIAFMVASTGTSYAQEAVAKKVMVLAKFDNNRYNTDMEDAMLRELKNKGVDAMVAHKSISSADAASEEAFIARLKALGVTGLIVFADGSMRSQYRNNPSINAGVNVPVKIGIFRAYIGGNVPIGGGTRKEQKVTIHAYYFDKEGENARWETLLKGNLNQGSVELARKFAGTTYKKLSMQPFF